MSQLSGLALQYSVHACVCIINTLWNILIITNTTAVIGLCERLLYVYFVIDYVVRVLVNCVISILFKMFYGFVIFE